MAKWITTKEFSLLSPINVFGKEHSFSPERESTYFNKHILFRKKFTAQSFEKATLRICADDYYKLYINGKFICMGPSPSYPSHTYFNEVDLSDILCSGENTFAVHTWYMGLRNRVLVSGDDLHGLYLELYLDGKLFISSDESFKVAYHTGFSHCGEYGYKTGFLEVYDSNSCEVGFEEIDFDDSAWEYAVENKNLPASHKLYKKAQLLDVYDIKPQEVKVFENRIFVDVGRELCGYITYTAKGNKGDTVIIRQGEELNDDKSVRFELRCNCRFEEKHILSGKSDRLCQYDYKGFRYAEIILPEGCCIDPDSITVTVRHYPYNEKADLATDNKKLDGIFRLCADTVKYGVQEVCVDCPTREKGQYLGDAGFIGMSYAALCDDTSVLEKVLFDFAHSSFICNGLMAVSTSSFNQEIADYSLMYPYFVYWCYCKNKNENFLREIFPAVEGVIRYFSEHVKDGVLCDITEKWNLVDWPMNLRDGYDFELTNPPKGGVHNVIAAYYIGACEYYEKIRKILGMIPAVNIDGLKEAFVKKFYNSETALFVDAPGSSHSSLHSNVLPMLYDISVSDETKKRTIDMIRQKRLLSVNYFAFFVLLALEKEGEYELMRKLICDDGSWSNMIAEGATVCFEAWGKDQKWNTSLFHPWMSYPVIFADKIK